MSSSSGDEEENVGPRGVFARAAKPAPLRRAIAVDSDSSDSDSDAGEARVRRGGAQAVQRAASDSDSDSEGESIAALARGPSAWSLDTLSEAVWKLRLAKRDAVDTMIRNVKAGKFELSHYTKMYGPQIAAASCGYDDSKWTGDLLFGRLEELELATPVAIDAMREHVASGKFTLEHYVELWKLKISAAMAGGVSAAEKPQWTAKELFDKLLRYNIATEVAVESMERNLESGRFGLGHYVKMYQGKVAQAEARAR
eukprot:SAG11_NODE_7533_length_1134_cov_1.073430_1_plen_255_part_00